MHHYTTRLVTEPKDIEQAEELWSLAFGTGWARGQGYAELTRVLGAFEGAELHAVVGIIDYDMNFNGSIVKCGGAAAVATTPGQRYQSLIKRLFKECIEDMHRKGFAFTALYPFSFPFYEKLGYAGTQWDYWIETNIAWLKHIAKKGNAKKYRLVLQENAAREIVPRHNEWAKNYNLSLIRTESKFNSMLTWKGSSFKCFVHDDGYLVFHMDRSTGNTLMVPEFAYRTEEAFIDGLALLAQMDSQYDKVRWLDSDPERFWRLGMPQPRAEVKRTPGMMTRVVNVDAFQKALGKPVRVDGMTIADPLEVSGPKEGTVGVGEIVQIVTGFWNTPPKNEAAKLYKAAAKTPCFTVERY